MLIIGKLYTFEGETYKYIGTRGRNCYVLINDNHEIAFSATQLANMIDKEIKPLKP